MTIDDFIHQNGITLRTQRVASNPGMPDMPAGSRHFRCVFQKGLLKFALLFSQGSAHPQSPFAHDVLGCLLSDFQSYTSARSFEEWASDLGFDSDSRRAEQTYRTIDDQWLAFQNFVGHEAAKLFLTIEPN